MTLVWSPDYEDAPAAYIAAVEAADGQGLEEEVKAAYTEFILGCISDGIWDAIKASCILAGARTLSGALVPLAGTAPTNNNFVAGDYNRKTGLVGDGSTKYLDSNRNNNADPQDSNHNSVFITVNTTLSMAYLGAGNSASGSNTLQTVGTYAVATRSRNNSAVVPAGVLATSGLYGTARSGSASYIARSDKADRVVVSTSQAPFNGNIFIFARGSVGSPSILSNARIAFYSIGESLDLAKLDARVSTLISDLGAAIP